MLLLNLLESPIGRVPIITQAFDRIRLCFRMEVRFSDSLLASHRINQRERMPKYTCRCSWHALKFSLLCLVSSFWLSGHLFLVMQLISAFIETWNGPTWKEASDVKRLYPQATLLALKEDQLRHYRTSLSTWSEYSPCEPISVSRLWTCDQSAFQESQLKNNNNKNNPNRI